MDDYDSTKLFYFFLFSKNKNICHKLIIQFVKYNSLQMYNHEKAEV